MKIQRFEDMQIWQEAGSLVKLIYKYTTRGKFHQDFGLKDQIQRASVSLMSNIAENYQIDSNKKFIRFLLYSKGSAGEVRGLLYVDSALGYLTEEEFSECNSKVVSIIK